MKSIRSVLALGMATLGFSVALYLRDNSNPWLVTTAAAMLSLVLAWPVVREEWQRIR